MTKPDFTKPPPKSVLDVDTGNRLANVLMRITPEDGAVGQIVGLNGQVVEYGKLRDDWPDICLKAAEAVDARKEEIRERVKSMYIGPWMHEHFAKAMMQEAIAERDRLLAHG